MPPEQEEVDSIDCRGAAEHPRPRQSRRDRKLRTFTLSAHELVQVIQALFDDCSRQLRRALVCLERLQRMSVEDTAEADKVEGLQAEANKVPGLQTEADEVPGLQVEANKNASRPAGPAFNSPVAAFLSPVYYILRSFDKASMDEAFQSCRQTDRLKVWYPKQKRFVLQRDQTQEEDTVCGVYVLATLAYNMTRFPVPAKLYPPV
ncbi:hypothetical protein HDK90DRAFT_512522 [Phyllosticta capitalensis]|uniref:Ubiquitin-like protease family profile domain-containing protein n=1 Tax=Phyllosticta capitalensis TaxID=121624 RepID=A0ABR1YHI5_9PEZI